MPTESTSTKKKIGEEIEQGEIALKTGGGREMLSFPKAHISLKGTKKLRVVRVQMAVTKQPLSVISKALYSVQRLWIAQKLFFDQRLQPSRNILRGTSSTRKAIRGEGWREADASCTWIRVWCDANNFM